MTWRAGSEDLDEWLTHNSSLHHMVNMALFTVHLYAFDLDGLQAVHSTSVQCGRAEPSKRCWECWNSQPTHQCS